MSQASIKVSQELQAIAAELEARLRAVAGTSVGFSLFVWTEGRSNYIANVPRKEVVGVLEAHIQGWKKGAPDVPAHKVN